MNRAKWFAVRKPSTGKTIAKSDCGAEILLRYKDFVLYSPDPPFLYGEGSGFRTTTMEIEFLFFKSLVTQHKGVWFFILYYMVYV